MEQQRTTWYDEMIAIIKANGAKAITGPLLQQVLINLGDSSLFKASDNHLLFRKFNTSKSYSGGSTFVYNNTIYIVKDGQTQTGAFDAAKCIDLLGGLTETSITGFSDYDNATTYNNTTTNKANYQLRLFRFINVTPTQGEAPLLGDGSLNSAYWEEVAYGKVNASPWIAGFYDRDAVVRNGATLYYLDVDGPYESTNFATDLAAEKWKMLGGGGGTSLELINNLTNNVAGAALDSQQGYVLKGLYDDLLDLVNGLNLIEESVATFGDLPNDSLDGVRIWVEDASADPTVSSGWAIYRSIGDKPSGTWVKMAEQESIDLVLSIAAIPGLTAALLDKTDKSFGNLYVSGTSGDGGDTFISSTDITTTSGFPLLILLSLEVTNTGDLIVTSNGDVLKFIDANGEDLTGAEISPDYIYTATYQGGTLPVGVDAVYRLLVHSTNFAASTGADLVINPKKIFGNNYLVTTSATDTMTFLATDVPDGATGVLAIKKFDGTISYIDLGENIDVKQEVYEWLNDQGTSDITISSVVDDGSGHIQINYTTAHGLVDDDLIVNKDILGSFEANGEWLVTVVDSDSVTLNGSSFNLAYSSGGTSRKQKKYLALNQTADAITYFNFIVQGSKLIITNRTSPI